MLGAGAGAMEEVNTWHHIPLLARQVVVFDLECAHDALRGTYGARGGNLGTQCEACRQESWPFPSQDYSKLPISGSGKRGARL